MKSPYRTPGTRDRDGGEGFFRSLRRRFFPTDEERREDEERRRAETEAWLQDLMQRRGPSPYPWISDALWAVWNRSEGAPTRYGDQCPIHTRRLTVPSPDDLARAPRAPVPEGAPLPATGTDAEHNALLDSTRGGGFLNEVHWPVCCGRLATLLSWFEFDAVDAATGHSGLDACALEALAVDNRIDRETLLNGWRDDMRAIRNGEHRDGRELFQCRSCGRIYGSDSEP